MKQSSRVAVLLLLLLQLTTRVVRADDESRSISIVNESGHRVQVHWIDPDDGELVPQIEPDLLNGASFNLNSYVGHNFEVRELPAKKTGVCAGEDQNCGVDYFTVNSNHDQGESRTSIICHQVVCRGVNFGVIMS